MAGSNSEATKTQRLTDIPVTVNAILSVQIAVVVKDNRYQL